LGRRASERSCVAEDDSGACGPGLVRLSVGLEDAGDLLADIEVALEK
jgi:cystathionine beta-lyase/cystathionine gamma-synthase